MKKLLSVLLALCVQSDAVSTVQSWHLDIAGFDVSVLSDDELKTEDMAECLSLSSPIIEIIVQVTNELDPSVFSEELVQLADSLHHGVASIPYPIVFLGVTDALELLRSNIAAFPDDYYHTAEQELETYVKKIAINKAES